MVHAIRDAGVPFEAIFPVFDELFTAKVCPLDADRQQVTELTRCRPQIPPWHTSSGLVFLATDIVELLTTWLAEAASAPSSLTRAFPATEVESAIGRYLMGLQSTTNAGALVTRLQDMQRAIRRKY